MLKTICIVVAFYCVAFLCSCQKELAIISETLSDTIPTTESYIPLTAGTFWVYKDSASGQTDTVTVLSDEWLHDNIPYKKAQVVSDTGVNYSYYGILEHNYYLYGEFEGNNITMLVLNDLANVGSPWVYDMGMISGVPARGTGTVLEKNITYPVQGQLYQNVIHTQYVIALNLLGSYVNLATYDFYFAKGIGVIKIQASISDASGGSEAATQELTDYTIK